MWLLSLLLVSSSALAAPIDRAHLPPSFPYRDGKAVFVDFIEATYDVTYDAQMKRAFARASIRFESSEAGYPIFDSVSNPTTITIDAVPTRQSLVKTPNHETSLRVIDTFVTPGFHALSISLPIEQNVTFTDGAVESGFWDTDLTDRSYLEKYLPSNLIYDRYAMKFRIHFIGLANQAIYTNGDVNAINANEYEINYPDSFTANSIFFHTLSRDTVEEIRFQYPSIDGRSISAVIYRNKNLPILMSPLPALQAQVTTYLMALENQFGPYPHPSLTSYMTDKGGMEYNGGFVFSESAINHELSHAYFGRGIVPVDGNAGWIDEALAVWWTSGMPATSTLPTVTGIANQPQYTRVTDRLAYSLGKDFLAYLNGLLASQGGLKPFLVDYLNHHRFEPYTTKDFARSMSQYYQIDLVPLFQTYVFGTNPPPAPPRLR